MILTEVDYTTWIMAPEISQLKKAEIDGYLQARALKQPLLKLGKDAVDLLTYRKVKLSACTVELLQDWVTTNKGTRIAAFLEGETTSKISIPDSALTANDYWNALEKLKEGK